MSVNYSILANNPVWNGNTTISDATTVPKFDAATPGSGMMLVDVLSGSRTVLISNVGTVNLFLADSSKTPADGFKSGILLQPGVAITVGLSGASLILYNGSTTDDGSFVSVSYS